MEMFSKSRDPRMWESWINERLTSEESSHSFFSDYSFCTIPNPFVFFHLKTRFQTIELDKTIENWTGKEDQHSKIENSDLEIINTYWERRSCRDQRGSPCCHYSSILWNKMTAGKKRGSNEIKSKESKEREIRIKIRISPSSVPT